MKKFLYCLIIGLLYFLSLFPLSFVRKIGNKVGPVILKNDKRTIKYIKKNISICFPDMSDEESKAFINKRLSCMFRILLEMSHVWIKPKNQLISYLRPTYNNEVFESEIKKDNGVIVLIPHIGNWEMMNVYLSQYKTLTAMYQPFKNAQVNRFILRARERLGSQLVPTTTKGVAQLMKALQNKGMVAFLPDQLPENGTSGVFAPLFGHQAYTVTLAHKLALRTNAKVFIGVASQCEKGFSVNIRPICDQFYSPEPTVAAACLNKNIEDFILQFPEQNQWEYNRYRIRSCYNLSTYQKKQ